MSLSRMTRNARCFLVPLVVLAAFVPRVIAEVPTADQVIDKAAKAMGGKAIEKIKSYVADSEMTTPMGTMTAKVKWVRPKSVRVTMTMPQMGDMEMGTDGTIAWRHVAMMGGY